MSALADALREMRGLTPQRVRAHARTATLLFALALAALWVTAREGVDAFGRPVGTDFASFYAAGVLAREGRAVEAYDWQAIHAVERAMFGEGTPLYIWTYPPFSLLPMSGLAALPYALALCAFLGGTFALCWQVARRVAPPGDAAFWAIAGFPAVWMNAAHGQNGFLSAAILGAGLCLMPARPFAAGAALGLLAFKPQLMVLVPVALLLGRRWRALGGLVASVAALCAVSLHAYGLDPWVAQFAGMHDSRQAILESGATGFHKLQSALAAVRLLGGPASLGWALQAACGVVALAAVAFTWRGSAPDRVKMAVLIAASLLATPFLNVYDLVILGLPIAVVASEIRSAHALPWERLVLLIAWLLPAVSVTLAESARLPLTPAVLLAMVWVCHRRARAWPPDDLSDRPSAR